MKTGFRSMLLTCGAGLMLAHMATAASAASAQEVRAFDLAAQQGTSAIPRFAQQAGVQIVAPGQALRQVRTNAVRGSMDVRAALRRLLEGTGLTIVSDDGRTIILAAPARSSSNMEGRTRPMPVAARMEQPAPARQSAAERAFSPAPPAAERDGGVQDIIVTARRVSESLQTVPVSVTAFSGADLAARNITNVREVALLTPGFRIDPSTGNAANVGLTVRGQNQTNFSSALDAPVGTYVDGVYWARSTALNTGLVDIQSIQVLKGPQGTLFGRNSTGGALLINTNDPNYNGLSGEALVSYSEYEEVQAQAIVNVPLVADKLAVRLVGSYLHRDGYGHDIYTNAPRNNAREWLIRGKVRFDPADNVSIILAADKVRTGGNQIPRVLALVKPNSAADMLIQQATGGELSSANFHEGLNGSKDDGAEDVTTHSSAQTRNISATMTADLGGVGLKAIVANRKLSFYSTSDIDGTPAAIIDTIFASRGHQWSGELQATGKLLDDRFAWTVGGYLFSEHATDNQTVTPLRRLNPNATTFKEDKVVNDAWAIYAHGTYQLTDNLNIAAGVRYSSDDKKNSAIATAGQARNCQFAPALLVDPAICSVTRSRSDSKVTYNINADLQLARDIMVYGKVATGYRSGGVLAEPGTPDGISTFSPESVTDYEVGFKTRLFDRRVRVNGAVFYTDYRDIQRSLSVFTPTLNYLQTRNAGKAHISGGELEIDAQPVPSLSLGGSLGIINPVYDEFIDSSGDRSGEAWEGVPRRTLSAYAQYRLDLGIGELSFRGDVMRRARLPMDVRIIPVLNPQISYTVVNFGTTYKTPDDRLEISLFAKNAFNKRYITNSSSLYDSLGIVIRAYSEPRRFGVSMRYRFGQ